MRFTEQRDALRELVRDVVDKEINPHVDVWEAAGVFPAHELFPKLGALGLLGLEYDPEYGGMGVDHSFTVVLGEELGRCDVAGVPMAIAVQACMATPSLHRFGSAELKTRFLTPAITGEQVAAVAVTEPDAGSDVAGIRTSARRDGGDWVINGTKLYITNGAQADWICLLVRTSDEGGYQGMSQVIVPTDTPGFRVGRVLDKLGNRSSDTAELVLEDVRVPVANTIGEIGHGFQQQMTQFQNERLIGCYIAVVGMERALRRTIDYLQERTAFGKPLMAQQVIQFRLAELLAEVDLLRHYNYAAAQAVVDGVDPTRFATIAKLKTGRLVREVADACLQFHGGMGYMSDHWVSRYFRDSRLLSIGGGADEVMLRILTLIEGMGRR
jgi:citronellyl-CoA dehydrogenase